MPKINPPLGNAVVGDAFEIGGELHEILKITHSSTQDHSQTDAVFKRPDGTTYTEMLYSYTVFRGNQIYKSWLHAKELAEALKDKPKEPEMAVEVELA